MSATLFDIQMTPGAWAVCGECWKITTHNESAKRSAAWKFALDATWLCCCLERVGPYPLEDVLSNPATAAKLCEAVGMIVKLRDMHPNWVRETA